MSRSRRLADLVGAARSLGGRAVVPVALYAALRALGLAQPDPTSSAEILLLATLSAVTMAAAAALSSTAAGGTALLVTTMVWTLGTGPVRATATVVALALGVAWAAQRHAVRQPAAIALRVVATSIAAQTLIASATLVRIGERGASASDYGSWAMNLVGLPVIGAAGLVMLHRRFGALAAAVAGAGALVIGPGWTVDSALAVLTIGVAARLLRQEAPPDTSPRARRILLPLHAAAGVAALVVLAWRHPWVAGLTAAAATLVWVEDRAPRRRWMVELLVMGGVLASVWHRQPTAPGVWISLATLAFLVPTIAAPRRRGRLLAMTAAGLMVAGAGLGPAGLVPGLVLAAVSLRADGLGAWLQGTWSGTLLAATAILAAYPWLRPAPISIGLDVVRGLVLAPALDVGPLPFLLLVWVALMSLATRVPRRWWRGRAPAACLLLAGGLALAWLATRGPAPTVVLSTPRFLDHGQGGWAQRLEAVTSVSSIVVESHTVRSLELDAGTIVGSVQLLDADQQLLTVQRLVLGRHTAEWAASRPDIAARPGFVAPRPWTVTMAPGGDHFASRFRARLKLETPVDAAWVVLRRSPRLPEDVRFGVYRVELER